MFWAESINRLKKYVSDFIEIGSNGLTKINKKNGVDGKYITRYADFLDYERV